ncbi:MAG TPA: hypothetical protein VEW03_10355 [Longimicrobiaceae bacterium]|nr:hypothetical protein [Longimicrobiaceae bacterium]
MPRILPGEVAWYVTGRFYVDAQGAVLDVGYFLHLQGVAGALFSGKPGARTAHFTFAADPFTAKDLTNGRLKIALDAVGEFGIYLRREPGARFRDPASFSAGEQVARLRRVSIVAGVTVERRARRAPLFAMNVFSAALVWSTEFEFGGRRYDLGRLLPNGVTQWGTASTVPVKAPRGYATALPFVGSAVAVGGPPAAAPAPAAPAPQP